MLSKGGKTKWGLGPWILAILIIAVIGIFIYASTTDFDIFPTDEVSGNLAIADLTFGEVFGDDFFNFLNYVFGEIPGFLNQITGNDISSAIIVMAIWIMFLLIFADIMKLFANFSAGVNWIVAGLMAIIGANLNFISYISVYFLTVLAIFGSLSVLLSLAFIFILFVLFHFGSREIRERIILRRAEDEAIKAVAGGEAAASGIDVLKKIAERAKKK